ncbi:HPr family phosphocarrier protein [Alphaproteobacteria bacterium]|jgi:phosphocarrier protein|nr:HPr family phosphocarrier protein [Alphaproteobacteria bacterium]
MASQEERNLRIVNSKGLHARAAAKLAKLVDEFDAVIVISKASMEVPGNSIMGLMMLGAGPGSIIGVRASGEEASPAIDAISDLVSEGFNEE